MLTEELRQPAGAILCPIENPHVNAAQYAEKYAASIADPEAFWAEQGGKPVQ